MLLYATTTTMQGLENIPYMDCSMSNFFLAVEETSILKAFLLKVIKNCLQNSKHTTKKRKLSRQALHWQAICICKPMGLS